MSGGTPKGASTPSPSNAERARDLSESALTHLAEQLESGSSEQFTSSLLLRCHVTDASQTCTP